MKKHRIRISSFIVIGIFVLLACTSKSAYGSQESPITIQEEETLKIGDPHEGGIIAYIFQPEDPGYIPGETHGLIAAPKDQGSAQWGCLMQRINTTSVELGTGLANTMAIVRFHDSFDDYYHSRKECYYNDGTIAAKICAELELNGYSDWYLPGKDELNILYQNRRLIGGFVDADYWSSSEGSGWNAWFRRFYGSGNQGHGHKDGIHKVRAVRTF